MTNLMMGGFLTSSLSDDEKANMTSGEIATWEKQHTKYLFDYGISTLSYFTAQDNEHHAYHIDGDPDDEDTSTNTDKLKAAIVADPDGTAEFFANLCKSMYDKLDKLMASTDYSSIYKVYNDKQLQSDYDDYTTKISDAEDELSDYEDKWYDKFGAMETALSKLQSNSSVVSSMLGTS
jgi:flagellar hook-associated protein 2